MKILHITLWVVCLMLAAQANALEVLGYLTDKQGHYAGPTVEDNIAKMDIDKSGFADVTEVRAFLALKYGEGYKKNILDRWAVAATSQSCGTSFAKDLTE